MEFDATDRAKVLVAGGVAFAVVWLLTVYACRMYAEALAEGRDSEAGFWGFLAVG
jgi:hypothetical protein